jgi:hypothetical protein
LFNDTLNFSEDLFFLHKISISFLRIEFNKEKRQNVSPIKRPLSREKSYPNERRGQVSTINKRKSENTGVQNLADPEINCL